MNHRVKWCDLVKKLRACFYLTSSSLAIDIYILYIYIYIHVSCMYCK